MLLREAAKTSANRPLLISLRIPRNANSWTQVVLVSRSRPVRNVADDLDVVTKAEVQRQVVANTPVVLNEASDHICLGVHQLRFRCQRECLIVLERYRGDARRTAETVNAVLERREQLLRHVIRQRRAALDGVRTGPQCKGVRGVVGSFGQHAPRALIIAAGGRVSRALNRYAIALGGPPIRVFRILTTNLI